MDTLKTYAGASETLLAAMEYALTSGGKRFRPMLLLTTVALGKKKVEEGFPAATALEWIHTYSLIHDDLPAMDNDDYRRGKLTTHKKFDEATAILAGDGLLTAAFLHVLDQDTLSFENRVKINRLLSAAAGPNGMVAGQIHDIEGEQKNLSIDELALIHHRKTGELIEFAIEAGCIIAEIPAVVTKSLMTYGKHLGLAYQIHNDLKDVVLEEEETGKVVNRDQELGKNTYPSLLGVAGAFAMLQQEIDAAEEQIQEIKSSEFAAEIDLESLQIFIDLLEYVKIKPGA